MSGDAFHTKIQTSVANANLQEALDGNAERRRIGRETAFASLPDAQARRRQAHQVRAQVVEDLDTLLAQFIEKVQSNGVQVHRAATAQEAAQIVLKIVEQAPLRQQTSSAGFSEDGRIRGIQEAVGRSVQRQPGKKLVAKSKSMVSEEIELNHFLEACGHRVVETDLGEYIIQLRGERPSHIITPAVHLRRSDVGRLFQEKLGTPYTESIPEMTETARQALRQVFLSADVGLTGVNFGVVESGSLVVLTNEGNGRMVATLPPVHIALMGMERLVRTMDELALMLSLLPRSATGQKLTVYTQLLHGPQGLAADGPQERHLVIVDNGRAALRASPLREALFCIRCGACLNACPVFREMGGHAYTSAAGAIAPYPGPIGSVISPGLFGAEFAPLAEASSLCGACKEACPVDIDLPSLLLRVRAGLIPQKPGAPPVKPPVPGALALGLKLFGWAASRPRLFALGQRFAAAGAWLLSPRTRWMRLPAATGWGYSKAFPRPAGQSFRARYAKRETGGVLPARPAGEISPIPAQGMFSAQQANLAPVAVPPPLDPAERVQQFTQELLALGGKPIACRAEEFPEAILSFLNERRLQTLLVDDGAAALLRPALERFQAAGVQFTTQPDPALRAGLTSALLGLAQSGSLGFASLPGSPLAASLLPEIHLAALKVSQVWDDLAAALRSLQDYPSAVLVSGPSRTADIEMTLTIGVHGPKELVVFLIEDL